MQQPTGIHPAVSVAAANPQAVLFEQMSSQAAASIFLQQHQQQQQQQHQQSLVAAPPIVSNTPTASINSISTATTLPTFSPLFNVPQTSSVNSNFFAAALQQQIANANAVPGGIANAGQQPFATALQHQIAQIHQHQQQQQQQHQQALALAASQASAAAAVHQNPFVSFALNGPAGLTVAQQNQLFAAAAAAQGHQPGIPGGIGHPGLVFMPRLP